MARTQIHSSTRNPLAIDPEREQRIRERAYHLWEADGKPHGRDVEYWERARELIGTGESAGSGLLAHPRSVPGRGNGETAVRARLGDSPDRPADRAGPKSTPAPKRRSPSKPKKPVIDRSRYGDLTGYSRGLPISCHTRRASCP